MDNNTFWAIALIAILIFMNQPKEGTSTETTDLSNLIDASVSFTGKNKYKGTALTDEEVRVIKVNGEKRDLGAISLDSGTLSTTPGDVYKFYYFMNTTPSTLYYVDMEEYTAPQQDSVDPRKGEGCAIDSSPILTTFNAAGAIQSSSANQQSVTTSEVVDLYIKIKVHGDECYGTPNEDGKDNAVCFVYNSTNQFASVVAGTQAISTPLSISASAYGSRIVDCYTFPPIENHEYVEVPVRVTGSSGGDPDENINVVVDDICVDVNDETLEEVWDYVDENHNTLCASATSLGSIYIT